MNQTWPNLTAWQSQHFDKFSGSFARHPYKANMAQSFGSVHAALARGTGALYLAPALGPNSLVLGTGFFFGTGSFSGTGIFMMPVNPSWEVRAVVPRSTFPSQKCQKTNGLRPLLEVAMSKKCAPLWREAHFQVKSVKDPTVSDHFWKLRCRRSARRCGAKHISKSRVSKTNGRRPLLEVAMSKKCALLSREAHFQVKSVKN